MFTLDQGALFWLGIGVAGSIGLCFLWKGICWFSGIRELRIAVEKIPLKEILLFLVVHPLGEELFFRGPVYFLPQKSSYILVFAIIIGLAVFFGILHFEFGLPQFLVEKGWNQKKVIAMIIWGFFLGWLTWKTDSLLPAITSHVVFQGAVLLQHKFNWLLNNGEEAGMENY